MTTLDTVELDDTPPPVRGLPVVGAVSIGASLVSVVVLAVRYVTMNGQRWSVEQVAARCGYASEVTGAGETGDQPFLLPLAVAFTLVGAVTAPIAARRSASAWATVPVAALGLAVTAWSTGFGRDGPLVMRVNAADQGCDGRFEPTVLPVGMAVGITMVAAAGVWAVARRRAAGRGGWAVSAVVALLGASVALSVLAAKFPPVYGGYSVIVGRPLRDRGHRRRPVPPPGGWPGGHWHGTAVDEAMAAASFEQVALELAVLGAPIDLVERCRDAAEDERRHARLCLHLVAQEPMMVDGDPCDVELPPIPAPTVDAGVLRRHRRRHLLRVALEAHLDGVRNEGAAAAAMHRRADQLAADPDATPAQAAIVRSIALDEDRHALLNADIVSWARHAARSRV